MAINPQINDMAWFGKPADLVGSFQQGMNLAEQSQRMKQSADMHPLKMADLQSQTDYRSQQTSLAKQRESFNKDMHPLDMAAKRADTAYRTAVTAGVKQETDHKGIMNPLLQKGQGLLNIARGFANEKARLENEWASKTLGDRIEQEGVKLKQSREDLNHSRANNLLLRGAQSLSNTWRTLQNSLAGLNISKTAMELGQQAESVTKQSAEQPLVQEQLNIISSPDFDASNYKIPANISHPDSIKTLEGRLEQARGTVRQKNLNAADKALFDSQVQEQTNARNKLSKLDISVRKVIQSKGKDGKPLYMDGNDITMEGIDVINRISAFEEFKTKLSPQQISQIMAEDTNTSLDPNTGLPVVNQWMSGKFVGDVYVPSRDMLTKLGYDAGAEKRAAQEALEPYSVTVDGVEYRAGKTPTDQTPKVREQILERFESNLKRLSDQKDNGVDPVFISEEEKEAAFIDARDTVLRLYGKERARKSASMPKLEPSDEAQLDRMMRLEAIRITGEKKYNTDDGEKDGLITGGDTAGTWSDGKVGDAMAKVEEHFRNKGINVLINPDQIRLSKVGDVVIRPLKTGGYEAVQVTGFTDEGITGKRINEFYGFDGEYRPNAVSQPAKKPSTSKAEPTKKPNTSKAGPTKKPKNLSEINRLSSELNRLQNLANQKRQEADRHSSAGRNRFGISTEGVPEFRKRREETMSMISEANALDAKASEIKKKLEALK